MTPPPGEVVFTLMAGPAFAQICVQFTGRSMTGFMEESRSHDADCIFSPSRKIGEVLFKLVSERCQPAEVKDGEKRERVEDLGLRYGYLPIVCDSVYIVEYWQRGSDGFDERCCCDKDCGAFEHCRVVDDETKGLVRRLKDGRDHAEHGRDTVCIRRAHVEEQVPNSTGNRLQNWKTEEPRCCIAKRILEVSWKHALQ